jgi:hypothetical protein
MAEYHENMFSIPIFHFHVNDWEIKKEKIIDIASKANMTKDIGGDYCSHDYFDNQQSYSHELMPLVIPESQRLVDHIGSDIRYSVDRFWFESSSYGECHTPHNHGSTGFSAVMFVDYDEKEHEPTNFLCPFNNFLNGVDLKYIPPDITSGSVIFFPSAIHHFTTPNRSHKSRLILSWNMNISG